MAVEPAGYSASPSSGSLSVRGQGGTQGIVFSAWTGNGGILGSSTQNFYLLVGGVRVGIVVVAVAAFLPRRRPPGS